MFDKFKQWLILFKETTPKFLYYIFTICAATFMISITLIICFFLFDTLIGFNFAKNVIATTPQNHYIDTNNVVVKPEQKLDTFFEKKNDTADNYYHQLKYYELQKIIAEVEIKRKNEGLAPLVPYEDTGARILSTIAQIFSFNLKTILCLLFAGYILPMFKKEDDVKKLKYNFPIALLVLGSVLAIIGITSPTKVLIGNIGLDTSNVGVVFCFLSFVFAISVVLRNKL